MNIGQPGFIPGLGLPDEYLMKGPQFTEDSMFEDFGGKSLAEIFSKDVLEDAKSVVGVEFQYLYGGMNFTIDILVALTSDNPILPEGTKDSIDDIAGVAIAITIEDINKPTPGLNAWFTTNMILALTLNMMKISDEMKESALHELSMTLTAMMMVVEFAKSIADAIMKAAEKQSEIYKMQAFQGIMSAVSGGLQIVMGLASMRGHSKETHWNAKDTRWEVPGKPTLQTGAEGSGYSWKMGEGKPNSLVTFTRAGGVTSMAAILNGFSAAIASFVTATLILEKAQFEAYKVIQEVLKNLFDQLLSSSLESRKDLEDMIKKTLDDLANITTASRKAANI